MDLASTIIVQFPFCKLRSSGNPQACGTNTPQFIQYKEHNKLVLIQSNILYL